MIKIKEKIGENQIVILTLQNKTYSESITAINKEFSQKYKKICYVSLNSPYSALINTFKKKKIDINKKFFIIDGITESAGGSGKYDNCVFIKSPHDLVGLGVSINAVLKTFHPEVLLFDSVSTLMVYERIEIVSRVIHNLIGKIRITDCTAIFTILKEDADKNSIKELSMFADKTIDIGNK